jgi:hypothetical protein
MRLGGMKTWLANTCMLRDCIVSLQTRQRDRKGGKRKKEIGSEKIKGKKVK